MKKAGLTFQEHYEIGKNLRMIKTQAKSIENVLAKKIGETKKVTKLIVKIGKAIDIMTDELNDIVRSMPDSPPDIDNYYYKI